MNDLKPETYNKAKSFLKKEYGSNYDAEYFETASKTADITLNNRIMKEQNKGKKKNTITRWHRSR